MTTPSAPWGGGPTQFFYSLTPDVIDQVLREHGLRPAGRVLALNSLENRVYDVEVAKFDKPDGPFAAENVVVKFYRPGRWGQATIREEHRFLAELSNYELPVIAPIERDGETLFQHESSGLHYTVFPKVRGRLKDELNVEESRLIGRLIARLHNIGAMSSFTQRPKLDPSLWLSGNAAAVLAMDFIPDDLKKSYDFLVKQLETMIAPWFNAIPSQRVHGDFHRGNVLWTNEGAWITDLDDCVKIGRAHV
jgi:Ser/Thr protein kinase RdoA (MazF antagonist)